MRAANLIILTLALLSVAGLARAGCQSGEASMRVPAVFEESGQMLRLSVELREGEGSVFISTEPYVGVQTQNSERIAVSVASRILEADTSECDILFKIDGAGEAAEAVDGPSAGAAMTLMVLSALESRPLPEDLSMTGTIEPDGSVGPVGGVSAKAEAAARNGITIFLTPRLEMYERMLLSGVKKRYDIRVIEVRDVFEAASIAIEGDVPEEASASYLGTEIPEGLERFEVPSSPEFERFLGIAEETLSDAEELVAVAKQRGDGEFDEYFDGEIAAARELLDKGYYYTGANLAFLTMIDATAVGRTATEEELATTRKEVISCLASLRKPDLREDNVGEVFGGEARTTWARAKLAEIEEIEIEGEEVVLYKLRELEYSRSWCRLATRLYEYDGGGAAMDEGKLEPLAKELLDEARADSADAGEDVRWHMKAAEKAYENGDYGAVIYDSAYVIGTSAADGDMLEKNPAELMEYVERTLMEEAGGLWPGLYRMQVRYYYASGEGGVATAFRMARFVEELKEANGKAMEELLREDGSAASDGAAGNEQEGSGAWDALIILAVMGVALVFSYETLAAMKKGS